MGDQITCGSEHRIHLFAKHLSCGVAGSGRCWGAQRKEGVGPSWVRAGQWQPRSSRPWSQPAPAPGCPLVVWGLSSSSILPAAPHGPIQQLLQLPNSPAGCHAAVPDGQQQPREDRHPCVQPFCQGHLLSAQNPHQPPAQWTHQLQGASMARVEATHPCACWGSGGPSGWAGCCLAVRFEVQLLPSGG